MQQRVRSLRNGKDRSMSLRASILRIKLRRTGSEAIPPPHRDETFEGFSAKYNCKMLVFYEVFQTMIDAIAAEKKLKGGSRLSKIKYIQSINPEWKDLSLDWEK